MWRRKMQYSELAACPNGRDLELFEAVKQIGWAYHHGLIRYEEFVSDFIRDSKKNGLVNEIGLPAVEANIDSALDWSASWPTPELFPELKPARRKRGKVIYLDSWCWKKGKL